MNILVVEDGTEYSDLYRRFLSDGMSWERAGNGSDALTRLARPGVDAVVLDMCFDRIPEADLLGDRAAAADRFNGDPRRALAFLQQQQGLFVLSALREAGVVVPVVFAHDFAEQPARFARLVERFGPLQWLPDAAGPDTVREVLVRSISG